MSVNDAVSNGNLMAVVQALDSLGDVNERDSRMATPLHIAVWSGSLEIAFVLIHRGADVEAKQMHGLTPLHVACLSDRSNIVGLLLHVGANVNSTDSHQKNTISPGMPTRQFASCTHLMEKWRTNRSNNGTWFHSLPSGV